MASRVIGSLCGGSHTHVDLLSFAVELPADLEVPVSGPSLWVDTAYVIILLPIVLCIAQRGIGPSEHSLAALPAWLYVLRRPHHFEPCGSGRFIVEAIAEVLDQEKKEGTK